MQPRPNRRHGKGDPNATPACNCKTSELLRARALQQETALEELRQLVARLEEFSAARADLSRLLWETKQRADEVRELQ